MDWRKSSFSSANGGQCLETANADGMVLVRDTTNREGAVLTFPAAAWRAFAAGLKQH
jgi:hypothetical protein